MEEKILNSISAGFQKIMMPGMGLYNSLPAVEAPLRSRRTGGSLVWFEEADAVT